MAYAELVGPGADDFGDLDGLAFIDRLEDRAGCAGVASDSNQCGQNLLCDDIPAILSKFLVLMGGRACRSSDQHDTSSAERLSQRIVALA
jgi:hypothetical protein